MYFTSVSLYSLSILGKFFLFLTQRQHITFTPPLQRIIITLYTVPTAGYWGYWSIPMTQLQLLHQVAFQNSISGPILFWNKNVSLLQQFLTAQWWRTALRATGFKRHFVLKPTKQVMGQAAARRTAVLIFLVPDSQLYLIKRPIRGLEAKKRGFVETAGNLKEWIESSCEIQRILVSAVEGLFKK